MDPKTPALHVVKEDRNTGTERLQERRSFPRTSLSLPVHLTVVPTTGSPFLFSGGLTGTTLDVSRGGCAVIADLEVAERSRCIARFPMATAASIPTRYGPKSDGRPQLTAGFCSAWSSIHPSRRYEFPPREPPTEDAAQPGRLLVVDDQAGIRGLLNRYLGDRGFEVECAGDGEEAFRAVMNNTPDIMLLDLYLPRLNGHDLLRRMYEMEISVDLIFTMSVYADTADAQECLRLGAADHLLKPLDLDHLYRSILLRTGSRTA